MIKIIDLNKANPYIVFMEYYKNALSKNQKGIEAVSISSFNKRFNEVESRFVNLKYIKNDEWIFFSNYNSTKAENFKSHDQITALFFWNSINVQIRIKAMIKKTSSKFSDQHFLSRSLEKNALAVSSKQSQLIDSYNSVITNYQNTLKNKQLLYKRPEDWGGYSFTPYYFEFWEGHESRLNKREIFVKKASIWDQYLLQP